MIIKQVALLCLELSFVFMLRHEKPVPLSIWPGRCSKNSHILNDCNWCWCDESSKYMCNARVCNEVDMFGHFNDAIQEINVGMDGHGVWRSKETPCEPGVQYEREGLLCVCAENGNWPNPVCRDVFRVLHTVDISERMGPIKSQRCEATKLYVIGCNVCFCPSTQRLDPELCTTRNCTSDDLVYQIDKKVPRTKTDDSQSLEIYAECQIDKTYKFGCRNCMCLRNNRLICDDCPAEGIPRVNNEGETYCDTSKPEESFIMGCNYCFCDKKGLLYCTVKQCLGLSKTELPKFREGNIVSVVRPFDDIDCVPGTKYEKDCNTCFCGKNEYDEKYYSCTLKECFNLDPYPLRSLQSDCIVNTVYELNCQICHCNLHHGVKMETCYFNPKCTGVKALNEDRSMDITKLHGYCEPSHTYQKDCNTCRCLPDGKVLRCTSHICNKKSKNPISVDIVPVNQNGETPCPKDHMYKVNCNICFCLSNGNVLCSTADCSKRFK